jgi:hypothetical protein
LLLNLGVLGMTAGAVAFGGAEPTSASEDIDPLWNSGAVFIGNSPADQRPGPFITCPLFFDNGHFANASHALDLSSVQTTGQVRGTITYQNNTIEPVFGPSLAVTDTRGGDGIRYLLVAGEGAVTGGTGVFKGVTRAIVRCKYKIAEGPSPLLVACIDCVIILVRR